MEFDAWLDELPEIDSCLTVDEMDARARDLCSRAPKHLHLSTIGHSRQGQPLLMIRAGRGAKRAVVVGCPHPNEPLGGTTVLLLAQMLSDHGGPLLDEWQWFLIPCADPDGTRLNEGWFKHPYDFRAYLAHYYRPPHYEQFEWSFPVKYKRLSFDRPLPETQAVMHMLADVRPDLFYSLHNTTISGVHYYVTKPWAQLCSSLLAVAEREGLPQTLGIPRMPRSRKLSGSVYMAGSVRDFYDLYEEMGLDPISGVEGGASSTDFADSVGVRLALVSEVPLFVSPKVGDTTPTTESLAAVLVGARKQERELIGEISAIVRRIQPLLPSATPFRTTVVEGLLRAEAKQALRQRSASAERAATVAESYDAIVDPTVHQLLLMSQTVRMIRSEIERMPANCGPLEEAEGAVVHLIDRTLAFLGHVADATAVPLRRLARVQLSAGLRTLTELQAVGAEGSRYA